MEYITIKELERLLKNNRLFEDYSFPIKKVEQPGAIIYIWSDSESTSELGFSIGEIYSVDELKAVARLAELADATDLRSVGLNSREGSSPSPGMEIKKEVYMKVYLLSATVMPNEGIYRLKGITEQEAREIVQNADEVVSYVGYDSTADYMAEVLRIPVGVNRDKVLFNDGDIAVVCKLKYRLKDPKQKGSYSPQPDDYEWFLAEYEALE